MARYGYIGLGCNRGNRAQYLRAGLAALRSEGVRVSDISSSYLTEPELGDAEAEHHPWYLNCVARVEDPPAAAEMLRLCLWIEEQFGRVRKPGRTYPRTLDLDLLLHGDEVIEKPRIQVPHPRLHVRRFVLLPMAEVAPDVVHPVEHATMAELLERLPDGKGVWYMAPPPDLARVSLCEPLRKSGEAC